MEAQLYSTPNLHDMQRWLRWVFTEPRGVNAALDNSLTVASAIRGGEPTSRLLTFLQSDEDLPVRDRLSIYANAYFNRLLEALGSNFPALKRALGDNQFRIITADYLLEHVSTSSNIEDLGKALPQFLLGHRFSTELSFLPDLARLEWTVLVSLYRDRLPPMEPSLLDEGHGKNWREARFTFDPTVHILNVGYPVEKLWRDRLLAPAKGKHRVSGKNIHDILIWRDEDWVQIRSLSRPESWALSHLKEGASLGKVCDELEEKFVSRGENISINAWFINWFQSGVLKGIQFG